MARLDKVKTAAPGRGDDTCAHASRVGLPLVVLGLSLGLLAACAAPLPAVTSGRDQIENDCVRASLGFNDYQGYFLLPFDIDRDAYQRCMLDRGHLRPPSAMQAP